MAIIANLATTWASGGIDLMAKYYAGQFGIFASTRNSETVTNTEATFTTADGYSGPVTTRMTTGPGMWPVRRGYGPAGS